MALKFSNYPKYDSKLFFIVIFFELYFILNVWIKERDSCKIQTSQSALLKITSC